MRIDPWPRMQSADAQALVRAVAQDGGPEVELVEPLRGGAVGAWVVRWRDGHEGVLTWFGEGLLQERPTALAEVQHHTERARELGLPVPRFEAVVPVEGKGAAILQERARGRLPEVVTPPLIEQLLDYATVRIGALEGTSFAGRVSDLYLSESGPGYCVHETLRSWNAETAAILARVENLGRYTETMCGSDLLHFDYHLGNVLVDPDDPDTITAILDWDGARSGTIAMDLAVLAFDLSWRSPGVLQERVEEQMIERAQEALAPIWAHMSLRLIDWSIRQQPEHVGHWVTVAERDLPDP